MKISVLFAALCVALFAGASFGRAQDNPAAAPASSFPLAAKADVDSHADKIAPPGAVNRGTFNINTWKYGHAFDALPNTPIWNPVKLKIMRGEKITSTTVMGNADPEIYCAAANSGVDFIWTEMQHSGGTWETVQKMWSHCPYTKAVPGVRIPNANEFDEQHALDLGAMVLVIPTVRSIEQAREAVKWAYYPPKGGRSQGHMSPAYSAVPGGYRNTFNSNLVLVAMIETLDGLRDADKIAALPGIDAVFAASTDLGNFAGYKAGDPDYEREINIVHDAALRAHKYLCGPFSWLNRPGFKCFQGHGGDQFTSPGHGLQAAFVDAEKREFGPLWNTPGHVTAGPFSLNNVPKRLQREGSN
jgi:2-dehydro-3-deoxyglucarate aldolase/4-hydroxy-2-oxoheptanedioate aldolase